MIDKLGRYRHFKGNEYRVYGTCCDSKNNLIYILYKRLNDDTGFWLRPYDMFFEQVERDGKIFDRFALIEKSIEYLDLEKLTARHSETMEVFSVEKTSDTEFKA